jgi:hypothetical protein
VTCSAERGARGLQIIELVSTSNKVMQAGRPTAAEPVKQGAALFGFVRVASSSWKGAGMKPRVVEIATTGLGRVMGGGKSLLVLLLGSTAALAMQSLTIGLAGVATWLLLIGLELKNPSLWRAVVKELRRRPIPLPCETDLLDESARRHLAVLERGRRDRERALACGPDESSEATLSLVETAGELEEQAIAQIKSLDRLGRYLSSRRGRQAPKELPATGEQSIVEADAEWSRRMTSEQAMGDRELVELRERLEARLRSLTDTLAVLPSRLAALRMHERIDVAFAHDRHLRERLDAEMTATLASGLPARDSCPL